ncbi:MAG TPA: TetR/AcrR family transcriptional regulator [Acidimicrobiales bacterium]|nr:TetR/AcrR family transcriptional regulator [Acidimicrobiales bacterium]
MAERPPEAKRAGRTRDRAIDARVLAVAGRHLAQRGYDGLSLAAVADEANTSRQALYRRWPDKASLAAAVVATVADGTKAAACPADPFGALVAELTDFQRGVSRAGHLSLVGTMLQDGTDADVRKGYRARVVAPRRRRLRAILEAAQQAGLVEADGDLEVAVTMCTGSWYGRALTGTPPPPRWPERTAALVWRSLGGTLPGSRPERTSS